MPHRRYGFLYLSELFLLRVVQLQDVFLAEGVEDGGGDGDGFFDGVDDFLILHEVLEIGVLGEFGEVWGVAAEACQENYRNKKLHIITGRRPSEAIQI